MLLIYLCTRYRWVDAQRAVARNKLLLSFHRISSIFTIAEREDFRRPDSTKRSVPEMEVETIDCGTDDAYPWMLYHFLEIIIFYDIV